MPDQAELVLRRLSADSTKIISMSISQQGYCLDKSGELDADLKDVQADVAMLTSEGTAFKTAPGFLVAAAVQRAEHGACPVSVLSCDTIDYNGDKAKASVLGMAELAFGIEFREALGQTWTFPNSLLDRAVIPTTEELQKELQLQFGLDDRCPVICESFCRWVVEDNFVSGRPALEGVLGNSCILVEDFRAFQTMHATICEGARQALAYPGILLGHKRICDAVADPMIRSFVDKYLAVMKAYARPAPAAPQDQVEEQAVTAPAVTAPPLDIEAFLAETMSRLESSEVTLLSIIENGSHLLQDACLQAVPRFPKYDGPSVRPLATLLACWVRYLAKTTDEMGTTYTHAPDEDLDALMAAGSVLWSTAAAMSAEGQKPVAEVSAFFKEVFGESMPDLSETMLEEAVASQLVAMHLHTVATTLQSFGVAEGG